MLNKQEQELKIPELNTFEKLINNKEFSDIVLVVNGGIEFHVHSSIITLNCPYYKAALHAHWTQNKTSDGKNTVLSHDNIDKETMQIILEFLYTFNTKHVTKDNIGRVAIAADFLGMGHLLQRCVAGVNNETSIELFKAAYSLDNLSLAKTCVSAFPELDKFIPLSSSLTLPMILFIVACSLSKYNSLGYDNVSCWKLILSWGISNNEGGSVLDVLIEMRRSYLFFGFYDSQYDMLVQEFIENSNDCREKHRVIELLKEHRNDGEDVSEKLRFVSKVVSTKPYAKQKEIIIQVSKSILQAEKHIVPNVNGEFKDDEEKISVSFNKLSVTWSLLYRGSEHQFCSSAFHSLCDRKGPTITLVKTSEGRSCAAYSCDHWTKDNNWTANSKGFITSIPESVDGEYKTYPCSNTSHYGVFNNINYGPCFGRGNDLFITDCCNADNTSTTRLGMTYLGADANPLTLFGESAFTVAEYEVFGVGCLDTGMTMEGTLAGRYRRMRL